MCYIKIFLSLALNGHTNLIRINDQFTSKIIMVKTIYEESMLIFFFMLIKCLFLNKLIVD